jgi:adenylylsulfate kinase
MSGYVVWMTGDRGRMDGLAAALRKALGPTVPSLDVLTEEEVRERLCSNEPPRPEVSELPVRRLGWLSHLLARNGCAAIALSGDPRRSLREEVRKTEPRSVELLVGGTLPPGYEPPTAPDVEASMTDSPADVAAKVLAVLRARGLAP